MKILDKKKKRNYFLFWEGLIFVPWIFRRWLILPHLCFWVLMVNSSAYLGQNVTVFYWYARRVCVHGHPKTF